MEERFRIITQRLQECIGEEQLRAILAERDLKVYWGTAPTGAPHFGYFVPMLKIADLLKAGCEMTILFADIHAVLDNMKSTFEIVAKRTEYYELVIRSMLRQVGVPLDKLSFIRGSSFQLKEDYTFRVYQLASMTTFKKAQHAGADVVKQTSDPLLSGCLYPLLQALDEEFLHVDAQLGGVDQRKIFMFARDALPRLGFQKRIHLMNSLIPGLGKTGKMSSTIQNSKIDFFDTDEIIRAKIRRAYSVDGQPENNCLLACLKHIIFPMKPEGATFEMKRPERYGGDRSFTCAAEVDAAFAAREVGSVDLKGAIADEMIAIITPLRETLMAHRDVYEAAYPTAQG